MNSSEYQIFVFFIALDSSKIKVVFILNYELWSEIKSNSVLNLEAQSITWFNWFSNNFFRLLMSVTWLSHY